MFDGFQIIYVEDDASVRNSLTQTLELAGFTVQACATAEAALPYLTPDLRGIFVSDVQLPKMSGLDLLQRVRQLDPELPVILVTAHGDVDMAVHAMRAGAYDFVEKPFSPERLVDVATRALEKRALRMTVQDLQRRLQQRAGIDSVLIGKSSAMTQLRAQLQNLADTSADVMVLGETGTGKELVARAIHAGSPRRDGLFVAVNCAAIPHEMLESELFGHEKGAFTGAIKERIGKFELADGGTLFLDEVTEMPMPLQAKLLRALQENVIERVGGNRQINVDIRVVAATNRDPREAIKGGKLREDLYYRLNVFRIDLPALKTRKSDIPELVRYFLARRHVDISQEAVDALVRYDWPGNVRELENVLERAAIISGNQTILPRHLPADMVNHAATAASEPSGIENPLALPQAIEALERHMIAAALAETHGNKSKAAKLLQISERSLWYKLSQYDIS